MEVLEGGDPNYPELVCRVGNDVVIDNGSFF